MKVFAFVLVIVTGIMLVVTAADFPAWGDAHSPPNQYLSTHYITQAEHETAVPNMVTAVLADYRGFDTMFETAVVFCAGLAIAAILGHEKKKRYVVRRKALPKTEEGDIIIRMATRFLVPVTQLFAMYVIAHGHHSPGGGFQGGVILAATFILMTLAFDLKTILGRFSEKMTLIWANVGLFIYAGIGVLCVLLGSRFLEYSALHKILPGTDEIMARSHSMLGVEIGVALTVMSMLFAIYAHLVSKGRLEDGL